MGGRAPGTPPLDPPMNYNLCFVLVSYWMKLTREVCITIKVVLCNIHFTNLAVLVWRYLKISVRVSATFTNQLVSNHTTKITQVPIEINGNLHVSQNCDDEIS